VWLKLGGLTIGVTKILALTDHAILTRFWNLSEFSFSRKVQQKLCLFYSSSPTTFHRECCKRNSLSHCAPTMQHRCSNQAVPPALEGIGTIAKHAFDYHLHSDPVAFLCKLLMSMSCDNVAKSGTGVCQVCVRLGTLPCRRAYLFFVVHRGYHARNICLCVQGFAKLQHEAGVTNLPSAKFLWPMWGGPACGTTVAESTLPNTKKGKNLFLHWNCATPSAPTPFESVPQKEAWAIWARRPENARWLSSAKFRYEKN